MIPLLALIISSIISILLIIISFICDCATGGEIIGGGAAPPMSPLQREVASEYSNLKLPRHKIPFNEFCYPKKFKLQNPQKFVAEYMAPDTSHMNMLGFHRIGAGKTITFLNCAEKWIDADKGKPLIILPASLIGGVRNELRGPFGNYKYISKEESDELKILSPNSARYKEIINKSNESIDANYDIMSFNKFVDISKNLNPPILIIDEVHNVLNSSGTYYREMMKFIQAHPKMRLLVLSATPIYDKNEELVNLLRLMRQDVTNDILENHELLRKKLDGLVSYYAGAPEYTFPKIIIQYEICKMSKFQSRWYRAEVESELKKSGDIKLHEITNNFYSKSRAKSNIVFPQGLSATMGGVAKLTKNMIRENLDTYSCKYAKLIKKLRGGELSFVYSNFANFGGLRTLVKVLHVNGYVDYLTHGPGPKRYALWTGEQTAREKDTIRAVYNSSANDDASHIQVILGSPAIKEGVSLLRTKNMHMIDPYWNYSKMNQIIGRVSRFCSHKSLPAKERIATIYFYCAVTDSSGITKNNFDRKKEISPIDSIDLYILKLAEKKRENTADIINILIESAVDRGLNNRS